MNILYIVPEMSHPGGIGRVTAIKANYLVGKGHNVTIVTEIQGDAPFFYELDPNIVHYDIGISKRAAKLTKIVKRSSRIRKILNIVCPDVVVYTYFTLPVKCEVKYKSVVECHFNRYAPVLSAKAIGRSKLKAEVIMLYQGYLSRKFDKLVVLTHQDKELWQSHSNRNNIIVIPNMMSFTVERSADLTNKRVIAVGRLDAQKSFDRLIRIWAKAKVGFPDWRLDIFGKGPDKEKYIDLIEELCLCDSVAINAPSDNIKNEYLHSSILCSTSTYEGWGLVLTEAMACGVPIISYDICCGPRDIINDSVTGFLIAENDEDAYVRALTRLMSDYDLRVAIGNNAREEAKKYEVSDIMKQWDTLFDDLV